jgi:putative ABC transport system permease protein
MQTLLQDLKYASRTLVKTPAFTVIAILTLALGLGANTAIFTVVNALLLRPLPYAHPDRLVMVWQDLRARGGPADEWASPGNFADWRRATDVFDQVAAISGWRPTLTGGTEPEALAGEQVAHEYFSALGIAPVAGRSFAEADDVPNAPRVALIGTGLWQRKFGGDLTAIGSVVALNGEPHEIIGVVPDGFRPVVNPDAEIWRPLRLNMAAPSRGAVILRVVGRLRDGVSLERAQAAASALARRLEASYPQDNEKTDFYLQPLHERVVGEIRPGLIALVGGVAFVLLIACANIANLLMARGSSRGREIGVRVALGAGRWRILRQLLTESLLLALGGGLAGVLLGAWAVDALVAIAPPNAPRLGEISLDRTVLAFAGVLSLLTGVLFGLAPAVQHARVDLIESLKDGTRGSVAAGGRGLRRALISAEVALALMLLTGGVLLVETFVHLQSADLGFRTDDILVGSVNPPRATYDSMAKHRVFYDQVLEKASALPGVQQAAVTSVLPLSAGDSDMNFIIEGRAAARSQSETPVTWYRQVSAGYFELIGMPIRRGRAFATREAAPSVVVNETFVRRYFPADDPLGRRIRLNPDGDWFSIIGVVADARVRGAREATRIETFVPYWQFTEPGMTVVLKGRNVTQLAGPLRQAVSSIDRNVPVTGLTTMSESFSDSIAQPRFFATLAAAFAGLALLLAAIGIYGVMSYVVSQRQTEIGVRMALGAPAAQVFRLVIGDGLRLSAIGVVIGAAGALLVARALASLLFGVRPTDPVVLAGAAAVLLAVAALASVVPAWRATRVDPMVALRSE